MASHESKPKKWLDRIKNKIRQAEPRRPSTITKQSSVAQFIPQKPPVTSTPDELKSLLQQYDYIAFSGRQKFPETLYVALAFAAEYGFEALVSHLLGLGARLLPTTADLKDYYDVTDGRPGSSPLHAALRARGYNSIANSWLLIKSFQSEMVSSSPTEADMVRLMDLRDSAGMTPLAVAAEYANQQIVAELLHMGAELECRDNAGLTPLHHASKSYYWKKVTEEVVSLLLDRGSSLELRDDEGHTPLQLASQNNTGHPIVSLLLDRGAALECRDKYGYTPLHLASQNASCYSTVSLLLDRGASLECRNDEGCTPLHLASQKGSCHKIVCLLLDRGAFIDCQNNEGRTPLHYSSGLNQRELVKRGADTRVLDKSGYTPSEVVWNGMGAWVGMGKSEDLSQSPKEDKTRTPFKRPQNTTADPFSNMTDHDILRWD